MGVMGESNGDEDGQNLMAREQEKKKGAQSCAGQGQREAFSSRKAAFLRVDGGILPAWMDDGRLEARGQQGPVTGICDQSAPRPKLGPSGFVI
jgi:hypothetical protein